MGRTYVIEYIGRAMIYYVSKNMKKLRVLHENLRTAQRKSYIFSSDYFQSNSTISNSKLYGTEICPKQIENFENPERKSWGSDNDSS